MKKTLIALVLALTLVLMMVMPVAAAKPADCIRIQDGELLYSAGHYLEGELLQIGYDIFGYNYQSHMFNGSYANVYLGRDGFPPYEGDDEAYSQRLADEEISLEDVEATWYWQHRDVQLVMKWNDAWLSNKDCNDDGLLDRHYGYTSPIGSGAWETNHQWGYGGNGDKWTYFVKIAAMPEDAVLVDGTWYTADEIEIGPVIWGSYAKILQISNDKAYDEHGVLYKSPASPGFGAYK